MKIFFVGGAVLLLAFQFLCQAYAIELCEEQDYYNLARPIRCLIPYNEAVKKGDPREAMFEIMKNYPFEKKDEFVKLLQRKIGVIDDHITRRQSQVQTEKVTVVLSKLENAKQLLRRQLEMVNNATQDTWVSVRDQARIALEETARSLRDVE
jgi:hypothetical protein